MQDEYLKQKKKDSSKGISFRRNQICLQNDGEDKQFNIKKSQ